MILGWRHVLSGELRINKKEIMPVEAQLHQSPAILWHDDELLPAIGNLLCLPALVVDTFHPAFHGSGLRRCLSSSLRPACPKQDRHREDASCYLPSQAPMRLCRTSRDLGFIRHAPPETAEATGHVNRKERFQYKTK